jgi:flagellar basal body rod protein FlgB
VAFNIIASTTNSEALKASLDASAARVRSIAQRLALASTPGGEAFTLADPNAATAIGGASAAGSHVDLEAEMARLADEQLRFEATARLLEKTYAGLRASLQDR